MHTSPAYAEDVYIGALNGIDFQGHRATFVGRGERAWRDGDLPPAIGPRRQPVHRPAQQPIRRTGRADVARRRADPVGARVPDRTRRPSRSPAGCSGTSCTAGWRRPSSPSGLAFACTHAMGLVSHDATIDYLIDLIDRRADGAKLPGAPPNSTPNSRRTGSARPTTPICPPAASPCSRPGRAWATSCGRCRDLRWWSRRPIRTCADPELAAGLEKPLRRRRLHRAATIGAAADGVGSCRFRARSSRIGLRTARQRRPAGVAQPAAAQLQPLRGTGQRRAAATRAADAERRSSVDPRGADGGAAAGDATALAASRSPA